MLDISQFSEFNISHFQISNFQISKFQIFNFQIYDFQISNAHIFNVPILKCIISSFYMSNFEISNFHNFNLSDFQIPAFQKIGRHTSQHFQNLRFSDMIFFQRCSHNFPYFLKYFGGKHGVRGSIFGYIKNPKATKRINYFAVF